MTHTYALMNVSKTTFDEIKSQMIAAGYDHAIHEDDDKIILDMNGIGISNSQLQSLENEEPLFAGLQHIRKNASY